MMIAGKGFPLLLRVHPLRVHQAYPYLAEESGSCNFAMDGVGAGVIRSVNITFQDEEELLEAVGNTGPVSVAFQVSGSTGLVLYTASRLSPGQRLFASCFFGPAGEHPQHGGQKPVLLAPATSDTGCACRRWARRSGPVFLCKKRQPSVLFFRLCLLSNSSPLAPRRSFF